MESLLGPEGPGFWLGFLGLVLVLLALDLGIFNRKAHTFSASEALKWSLFWIALGLLFSVFVFWQVGSQAGLDYLTAYVIEKSLSVDNLFVIALVFSAFGTPRPYQHRVLFWGIVGALVLRGAMILGGLALLERFHFLMYIFGGFLLFSGIKLLFSKDSEPDPKKSIIFRLLRKLVPMSHDYDGQKLFTIENGKHLATPLFGALVVVEAMDVVFAVDSIPAVFAVSQDPFIVYTSNVFAILGLRSLYFLLADALERFVHLEIALAIILAYVGLKMIVADFFPIPSAISLAVVLGVLGISVVTSLLAGKREAEG